MSKAPHRIAVTGFGWEIPALAGRHSLQQGLTLGPVDHPLFEPELKLGKKGLRYKERATLLALCAAKSAMIDAGWLTEGVTALDDDEFGVVVASNTGNLDTVCRAADTIRREHVNATSSMDLPNASSNVVAATIAIRFGLKAMNLMVCSGSSASLDALVLAANAIRNGRAKRMLVAAVETDGPALRSLLAGERVESDTSRCDLLEGATAVVLEAPEAARDRQAPIAAALAESAFVHADGTQRQGLLGLLDRHLNKPLYLSADGFLRSWHDEVFGALPGHVLELGPLGERSYGGCTLLQLVHHGEQVRSGNPDMQHGALLTGGGAWRDQRAGALTVEPASAVQ